MTQPLQQPNQPPWTPPPAGWTPPPPHSQPPYNPPQPQGWRPPGWTPPPPPGPPKKNSPKIAAIGCAGILALGTLIGIIGALGDDGTSTASAGDTTTSGDVPATEDTTTPTATPAGAASVLAWWAGGGQTHSQALQADFAAIGTDSQTGDFATVGADCASLSRHVEAAQAGDPVPDPSAQLHWAAALAHFHDSATDCLAGAAARDAVSFRTAGDELRQGNEEMQKLTARVRMIGGIG